jgi:succinylglutamate desuccinylase
VTSLISSAANCSGNDPTFTVDAEAKRRAVGRHSSPSPLHGLAQALLIALAVGCTSQSSSVAPEGPPPAATETAEEVRSTPPGDPRREHHWERSAIDGAPIHAAAERRIDALARSFPQLVTLQTIGHSVQGRPLRVLRVTRGNEAARPECVLAAGIHGHETSETDALFMLTTLLEHSSNARVAQLLESRVLWVLPMISPDGVANHLRLNANRTDLNRNFAGTWRVQGQPGDFSYPGPEPFSEPESRALRDFLAGREHLNVYVDLHRSAWLILVPFIGGAGHEAAPEALAAARELHAAMGQDLSAPLGLHLREQGGFTADWVWHELRTMAFTLEFEPSHWQATPPVDEDPRYRALLHVLERCGSYPRREP